MADQPSLADFEKEVVAFLDKEAEPAKRNTEFAWGEGSDSVSFFRDTTQEEVDAALEFRRKMWDAGLAWITGAPEYGGRGLSSAHQRIYNAKERLYQVPNRQALGVGLGMVGPTIEDVGSDAMKRKWLKALYGGEVVGCQLFSEPGAGSDLAAVSSKAKRDGDGWVVNGQKVWTSNAQFSRVGLLLTQTSPEPKHKNLTAFVLDMDTEGVEVRPLRQITGGHEFNEVFFDNVRIPDECRVGEVDEGWGVAVATLLHERSTIGGATGGGGGILRIDRVIGLLNATGAIEDPVLRQQFARLYTDLRTSRFSRMKSEQKMKAGQRPGPEMSLGKLDLVKGFQSLADLVTAVLGPSVAADTGEWGTFAWSQMILGISGMRLGGGTDEIQRNIIGERVLGLPKEPAVHK